MLVRTIALQNKIISSLVVHRISKCCTKNSFLFSVHKIFKKYLSTDIEETSQYETSNKGNEREHSKKVVPSIYDKRNFKDAAKEPFSKEIIEILQRPINQEDIELKPQGQIYLPEIKYRRILNAAFGPGGWALIPRSKIRIENNNVSREYTLFCLGRFVSQARGEQELKESDPTFTLATAEEAARSNGLVRCCKDLGIASELWDPIFNIQWRKLHAKEVWVEHVRTKDKKKTLA